MAKAALPSHTDPAVLDCPVLDGNARDHLRAATKAATAFSFASLDFLREKSPEAQAAWLKATVNSSRTIFQPWSMEILYIVAVLGRARFTEMHDLLGLSTRTLSDKLKALREAGFLEREVFDESPVRIEYTLTKHGARTAALASPLFAHLNLEALRAAGRR